MASIKKTIRELESMREVLGKGQYSIKAADYGKVLYRDLGNGYDFEIVRSDLYPQSAYKTFCVRIFVWERNPNHRAERKSEFNTIEDIEGIRSIEALETVLGEMVEKYLSLTPIVT